MSESSAAASSNARVTLSERIAPQDLTPLETFLAARWRLYASLRRGTGLARVEHLPHRVWYAGATGCRSVRCRRFAYRIVDPLVRAYDDVGAAASTLTPLSEGRGSRL